MAGRSLPPDRTLRLVIDQFRRLPRNVQVVVLVLAVVALVAYALLRNRPGGGDGTPPVAAPPGPGGAGSYLFCFWNVENLFDDRDDKRNNIDDPYDDAFAHDDALRRLKYDHVSDALLRMNAGAGPDVIACVEVESARAADLLKESLNAKIADPARRYATVAMKELSAGRHIAPCVITRVGVAPGSTRLHGGNLRVLETRLVSNGHELTVLATHWTSQLSQKGGGHGEAGRERYARVIREVVTDIAGHDPAADILVCGDFNDTPDSDPVVHDLKAVGDRSRVTPSADPFLLDLLSGKPPERYGTLWYGGKPLIYDHVCVTPGMLDARGWGCDPDSVTVVTEGLIRPGASRRQPWRFGNPDQKMNPSDRGYADHFPVAVRLTVQPAAEP